MFMSANHGRSNEQLFQIGFSLQSLRKARPHAVFFLAGEAYIYGMQMAELRWQVTPRIAHPRHVQYCLDE